MPNQYKNKVVFNGNTLIDISDTTATSDKILKGFGAYGADGAWIDGSASGVAGEAIDHTPFYEQGVINLRDYSTLVRGKYVDNVFVEDDTGTVYSTGYISKEDFLNKGMQVYCESHTPYVRFYDAEKNYISGKYRAWRPTETWPTNAEYLVQDGTSGTYYGEVFQIVYNKPLELSVPNIYSQKNVEIIYGIINTSIKVTADANRTPTIYTIPVLGNETYRISTSGYIIYDVRAASNNFNYTQVGGNNRAGYSYTMPPGAIRIVFAGTKANTTFTIEGNFPYVAKIKHMTGEEGDPEAPAASLGSKTIVENGTYSASSDLLDGYSEVSSGTAGAVSVSGSDTHQLTTQAATSVTPSTQTQTVGAAGRYMTGAVTVNPIPSQYIVPSGSDEFTQNGTYDVTNLASAVVNVPAGKAVQYDNNGYRAASTSYVASGVQLTVEKSGTYTVSWAGFRNTTSGTSGSELHINGSKYGSSYTTFSNSYWQAPMLTHVQLDAGDEIEIYARSRATNYYMCVANLFIVEE